MFYKILHLMLKIPVLQYIRFLFFCFDDVVLGFIKKPIKESDTKKILIVFPLALGDAVMMIGALESLIEFYSKKGYEITLLCQSSYEELFRKYVNDVIAVDIRGASVSPKKRILFLNNCRKKYYDIIIDPTGSEECTPGVFAVNAAVGDEKIGVLSARIKKYQLPNSVRNKIFDRVIYKEESNIHRVRYYAEVFSEICGEKINPKLANLPITNTLNLPEKYIVVFPSASMPIKRWPVENYVKISEKIIESVPIPIVLCGTGMDADIINVYKGMLTDNIRTIDFVGKTSVISMIELIGKASLVLTNDTSVYHIAVATGRKTCCITGDYSHKMFIDYEADGLVSKEIVRAVMPNWSCADCENHCLKVEGETYPCVLANDIDTVWENVCALLGIN